MKKEFQLEQWTLFFFQEVMQQTGVMSFEQIIDSLYGTIPAYHSHKLQITQEI